MKRIPESYAGGIGYVQSLNIAGMVGWLRDELFETAGKCHHLAGGHDDYPVQAIVNHYQYFTEITRAIFRDAIRLLFYRWKENPSLWPPEIAAYLLHLIGELEVSEMKFGLIALVESELFLQIDGFNRYGVLCAAARLSRPEDYPFWLMVGDRFADKFGGTAFQALLRISRPHALELLQRLPKDNESVMGSVERALPDWRDHIK